MQRMSFLLLVLVACFATALPAQTEAPKPDPALQKLSVLVGHWTYEEDWKAGPLGPGGKMTGVYDARMILGGFFLQAEQTEKGAMGEIRNLEIDAYDPVHKNFTSDMYLSDGTKSSFTLTISGNTITWAGTLTFGGKQYQFKEPMVFAPDSMSATAKAEISVDGKTWLPAWDGKWTKAKPAEWSDPAAHQSGFVTANGVRLNYLDWGGSGPALILIHGVGCNPHAFDDLAPAFTDRFHVIAYARRGHGQSEAKEPYDTATLTEDLRGLMDALGIAKAHLVGWSMGGNEITAMAGTHPERVDHIVYFDGAYDWSDPAIAEALKRFPQDANEEAKAMISLDAFRAYMKRDSFPAINDASRTEAYIRELVIVQADGTVRWRMAQSTGQASWKTLLTDRRDYTKVHAPALAIYAETFPDIHHGDATQLAKNLAIEKFMASFRAASQERIQRELRGVEILTVPGTHTDFFFTSRDQVVAAMRRFLSASAPQN
jgi:pimeloyl-ACP methyl ester carboxylesterase